MSANDPDLEPVFLAPSLKRDGFLAWATDSVTSKWMEYCDIWSWAPFIHEVGGLARTRDRAALRQNNFCHDALWFVMFLLAVFSLVAAQHHLDQLHLLAVAIACWRCVGHFISALRLTMFGWQADRRKPEAITVLRAQRRIIHVLTYVIELMLWYAVVYLALARYFGYQFVGNLCCVGQALQLSFATMSTIGYGTFAPVDVLTNAIAMVQFFTGLLYAGVTVATMSALLKTTSQGGGATDFPDRGATIRGYHTKGEIKWRVFLPPLGTFGLILVLYVSFSARSGQDMSLWIILGLLSVIMVCEFASYMAWTRMISKGPLARLK